jgi:hypothetical protein
VTTRMDGQPHGGDEEDCMSFFNADLAVIGLR